MLEIYFCNVGDGDAILLTERQPDRPDYTVLIDAGRPYVDLAEGSLRKEAIYYLHARGVRSIDCMILTHPHIDHIGGAARILRQIPTKRLVMLLVPPADAEWVAPSFQRTEKTQNGLKHLLNVLSDVAWTARETGCVPEIARAGTELLTDRLAMTTYYPRAEALTRQLAAFAGLYAGAEIGEKLLYCVSKERNQCSLMHRFTYAGRSVLLTGDRYGYDWEDLSLPPCDVLKLPHHGDIKSMTPTLIERLHPEIAVVSCQNDAEPKKDRPNADVLAFVQKAVPTVLCTENRAMPSMPAATHNGVCITIFDDGRIDCRTD